MRPFPVKSEFGSWDTLPEDPHVSEWHLADPQVRAALERRDRLKVQWHAFRDYPKGVWSDAAAERDAEWAELWRNWFLRRSWEGIAFLNAELRRSGS